MITKKAKKYLAGLTAGAAILASASAYATEQVNISGATLFADFFAAAAGTNDFIDVDGDGIYGYDPTRSPAVDQLAPFGLYNGHWIVTTRGVGSGSGLRDLYDWNDIAPTEQLRNPNDNSYSNAKLYYSRATASFVGDSNPNNAGGTPVAMDSIDIAVIDVPTLWFVNVGSQANANWSKTPGQDGYGLNPITAWDTEEENRMMGLSNSDGTRTYNINVSDPDENTIFDTEIAWVPIAIIGNVATGIENIDQEELQYLFTTGRMPSGENLVAATRDVGSGTRNGAMNTLGIDPSWGRGDNKGSKHSDANRAVASSNLGPTHQATNCGGSGTMETVVKNRRLAIGYTGLFGSSRAEGDTAAGQYEVLNLRKIGADYYVRPSLQSVFLNDDINTGWQIGGPETFSTVGNPFETNPFSPSYMRKQAAADYIRNIVASIDSYVAAPEMEDNFMPGQYLAYNYALMSAMNATADTFYPAQFIAQEPNAVMQADTFANHALSIPAYGSVSPAGLVPVRDVLPGVEYSDGSTGANGYRYWNGSSITWITGNQRLSARNSLQGDFNNDGVRDINDLAKLMEAVEDPIAFAQAEGTLSGYKGDMSVNIVVPEIIGDFNGDGNFDKEDVRYFADGLAIDANGKIDREAAFMAIDAISLNYFDTVLATGKEYEAGDVRGDIASSEFVSTAGAEPVADGVIDSADLTYMMKVISGRLVNGDQGVNPYALYRSWNWNNLDHAVHMDLSCDMNGDMVINKTDMDVLVYDILGTQYGDVNLDGVVDQEDIDIILANICYNTPGRTWAEGDMNGDGYVTHHDLCPGCTFDIADLNGDGYVDFHDFVIFASRWLTSTK